MKFRELSKYKYFTKTNFLKALIILFVCSLRCSELSTASIDPRNDPFVRIIVAEAADQPFEGQVAIACAMMARGMSIKGVVGNGSKLADTEPQWVIDRALRAISEAKNDGVCVDLIGNSTHWENVRLYGMPDWALEMKVVAIIGDHWFFERR